MFGLDFFKFRCGKNLCSWQLVQGQQRSTDWFGHRWDQFGSLPCWGTIWVSYLPIMSFRLFMSIYLAKNCFWEKLWVVQFEMSPAQLFTKWIEWGWSALPKWSGFPSCPSVFLWDGPLKKTAQMIEGSLEVKLPTICRGWEESERRSQEVRR